MTRDSVSMAEDATPQVPFEETGEFSDGTTLESILTSILRGPYLPGFGGTATWVARVGNVDVAVLSGRWPRPRMLRVRTSAIGGIEGALRLHFAYEAQRDPEAVYHRLSR